MWLRVDLFDFDEDALAGALFGRLDDCFELAFGNASHAFGASRMSVAVEQLLFAEVVGGFLDVEDQSHRAQF